MAAHRLPYHAPFHRQQTQDQSHTPAKPQLNTPNNQTEHPLPGRTPAHRNTPTKPQIPNQKGNTRSQQPNHHRTNSSVTRDRRLRVGFIGPDGRAACVVEHDLHLGGALVGRTAPIHVRKPSTYC
nr:hypothetical protein StreXyl84_65590 [Streptomyces sp. Xyl84]